MLREPRFEVEFGFRHPNCDAAACFDDLVQRICWGDIGLADVNGNRGAERHASLDSLHSEIGKQALFLLGDADEANKVIFCNIHEDNQQNVEAPRIGGVAICVNLNRTLPARSMEHYFCDYCWRKGRPYGKKQTERSASVAYKIVTDPYHRRYSIERYVSGRFESVVYDSILLDFRRLNESWYDAWERELVESSERHVVTILKDEEGRARIRETSHYRGGVPVQCDLESIHGVLVAVQKIYRTSFDDPWNGVILLDREGRPVMQKLYDIVDVGEFGALREEHWEGERIVVPTTTTRTPLKPLQMSWVADCIEKTFL